MEQRMRIALTEVNCVLENSEDEVLTKIPNISKNSRRKKIMNPVIHDFIATLFLFNEVCTSSVLKEKQFNRLKALISVRFIKHRDYFIKVWRGFCCR